MGRVHYGVLAANVLQLLNLRSRLQCKLRDCVVSSPGAVVMHIHRVTVSLMTIRRLSGYLTTKSRSRKNLPSYRLKKIHTLRNSYLWRGT